MAAPATLTDHTYLANYQTIPLGAVANLAVQQLRHPGLGWNVSPVTLQEMRVTARNVLHDRALIEYTARALTGPLGAEFILTARALKPGYVVLHAGAAPRPADQPVCRLGSSSPSRSTSTKPPSPTPTATPSPTAPRSPSTCAPHCGSPPHDRMVTSPGRRARPGRRRRPGNRRGPPTPTGPRRLRGHRRRGSPDRAGRRTRYDRPPPAAPDPPGGGAARCHPPHPPPSERIHR